jgi:hypothetical protein
VHREEAAAKLGVVQDILLEVNIGRGGEQIRLHARRARRRSAAKWQTFPAVSAARADGDSSRERINREKIADILPKCASFLLT